MTCILFSRISYSINYPRSREIEKEILHLISIPFQKAFSWYYWNGDLDIENEYAHFISGTEDCANNNFFFHLYLITTDGTVNVKLRFVYSLKVRKRQTRLENYWWTWFFHTLIFFIFCYLFVYFRFGFVFDVCFDKAGDIW